MTWHPPNTTFGENVDEISRRQKEIVSQQIDEWMIAQGATLPVSGSLTSGALTSGPEMTQQQQQPFNIIFGGDLVLGARMLKHMAERMHYGKIFFMNTKSLFT